MTFVRHVFKYAGQKLFFLFLDRWFAFVTVVSVLNAIKKALVLLEGLTKKETANVFITFNLIVSKLNVLMNSNLKLNIMCRRHEK